MSKKKGLKRGSKDWQDQQAARQQIKDDKDEITRHVVRQTAMDAAVLVLHDEFGFGAERMKRFKDAWEAQMNEFYHFFSKDREADPTMEYAKAKLDQALERIVGKENFTPWEQRYLPDGFEVIE